MLTSNLLNSVISANGKVLLTCNGIHLEINNYIVHFTKNLSELGDKTVEIDIGCWSYPEGRYSLEGLTKGTVKLVHYPSHREFELPLKKTTRVYQPYTREVNSLSWLESARSYRSPIHFLNDHTLIIMGDQPREIVGYPVPTELVGYSLDAWVCQFLSLGHILGARTPVFKVGDGFISCAYQFGSVDIYLSVTSPPNIERGEPSVVVHGCGEIPAHKLLSTREGTYLVDGKKVQVYNLNYV